LADAGAARCPQLVPLSFPSAAGHSISIVPLRADHLPAYAIAPASTPALVGLR